MTNDEKLKLVDTILDHKGVVILDPLEGSESQYVKVKVLGAVLREWKEFTQFKDPSSVNGTQQVNLDSAIENFIRVNRDAWDGQDSAEYMREIRD